ncbi:MAG: sulfatase [Verrucomicrobiota bacterium]
MTIRLLLAQLQLATLLAASCLASPKPNILIIAIDDLRPELNCYGATHIHSPNIDRLASQGTLFTHAYCQYALCGPSRTSAFTGLRPDSTKAYNNKIHFRDQLPDTVSLPQFFKENGYATYGFGKILHNTQSDALSWTEPQYYLTSHQYASLGYEEKKAGIDGYHASNKLIPLFEGPDVPDEAYRDGLTNQAAIAKLQEIASTEQPFLLYVGYQKPHTPFNAPKKYWDLYDRDTLPLATNTFAPEGAPDFALNASRYLRSFGGMPEEGVFPEALARETRHAYFACISYIDALIGDLLKALQATGEADNTLIALWSDHGYQLGEHGMWSKHSNFETSTHVPFILVDPRNENKGQSSDARVELIDLYPSLVDMASLPIPETVEGQSLAPLLTNAQAWNSKDTVAYSQFHRAGNQGYSVRTQDFRYTEWRSVKTGKIVAQELYDHRRDPDENRNVVHSPEYKRALQNCQSHLLLQWPLTTKSQR